MGRRGRRGGQGGRRQGRRQRRLGRHQPGHQPGPRCVARWFLGVKLVFLERRTHVGRAPLPTWSPPSCGAGLLPLQLGWSSMHQGGSRRYSENSVLVPGVHVGRLVHGCLVVVGPHVPCPPRGGRVLEHALGVLGEHF